MKNTSGAANIAAVQQVTVQKVSRMSRIHTAPFAGDLRFSTLSSARANASESCQLGGITSRSFWIWCIPGTARTVTCASCFR